MHPGIAFKHLEVGKDAFIANATLHGIVQLDKVGTDHLIVAHGNQEEVGGSLALVDFLGSDMVHLGIACVIAIMLEELSFDIIGAIASFQVSLAKALDKLRAWYITTLYPIEVDSVATGHEHVSELEDLLGVSTCADLSNGREMCQAQEMERLFTFQHFLLSFCMLWKHLVKVNKGMMRSTISYLFQIPSGSERIG